MEDYGGNELMPFSVCGCVDVAYMTSPTLDLDIKIKHTHFFRRGQDKTENKTVHEETFQSTSSLTRPSVFRQDVDVRVRQEA